MTKKTLLFSFALILTAFAAKSQTNLGFETWQKTGIYDMPDGWANSNLLGALFNDSASIIKSSNAYNSAYSMKLRAVKSTLAGGEAIPGFAVQTASFKKRAKTLRFQYHMKSSNDTGYISATLYNKNLQNDSNIVGYAEFELIPNADWQQKAVTFTYDNLKSVDSVEIAIFSGEKLTGYILIDNLSFSDFTSDITANENKMIHLYPNPAKGFITIENPLNSNAKLVLSNITGQTVFTEILTSSKQTIDITSINTGLYFYTINFENGDVPQTGKIVVE